MKKNILLIFFLFIGVIAKAQIHLPALVGDHMVLQQASVVKVWGWAYDDHQIELITSWDDKHYSTKPNGSDKKWIFEVKTPAAGGPYCVELKSGSQSIIIKDVMIGEVWLCSGQSNMEMPLSGKPKQPILNSDSLIASAANPQIRFFKTERVIADEPQKKAKGNWVLSSPESAKDFSALAYQFASMLNKKLNVSVGIIQSAWGGTPIRAWMSSDELKNFPEMLEKKDKPGPMNPSVLYNGMIAPLFPYGIKGFLWYQGENDHINYFKQYPALMQAMVEGWRHDWDNGNLPFYFVQIAPWKYPGDAFLASPFQREAQLKASHFIPKSGIAITADIGSDKSIHPPDKTNVADRLLRIALANTYNQKGVIWEGPEVKKVKIKGNQIHLRFSHVTEGLVLKPSSSSNFEIAGADQVFYPAAAEIDSEDKLVVKSDKVANPVALRYGFKDYFIGNLFNSAGLPASSFRTDKWEAEKK